MIYFWTFFQVLSFSFWEPLGLSFFGATVGPWNRIKGVPGEANIGPGVPLPDVSEFQLAKKAPTRESAKQLAPKRELECESLWYFEWYLLLFFRIIFGTEFWLVVCWKVYGEFVIQIVWWLPRNW